MNIVFCCWGSICEEGMINGFNELGHSVIRFKESYSNKDLDTEYIEKLLVFLKNQEDVSFVFSVNFIPIIAKVCTIHKIYYLSFVVDAPCITLYSASIKSSFVKTFLFDYSLYSQFCNYAPENIFYLSLGADTTYYDTIELNSEDHNKYDCDISFIGSYHTEMCEYDNIKHKLPDYMKGYIDGLIAAQLNVYGYNLIADSLDDAWVEKFKNYVDYKLISDYADVPKELIADYYIGYKCTQTDRINILNKVCDRYKLDLYTTEERSLVPKANYRGIADSKTMMPKIFMCSKINLNMTARTIKTGIVQRIFDVMAVGGFLISNYQTEIPEYFVPGEDIVLYESVQDLMDKIQYYLEHDDERRQIAKNGQEKVRKYHSYEKKLEQMIKMSEIAMH